MQIYLDSADLQEMLKWKTTVDGFTTNPTLMRRAGVADYAGYAREVVSALPGMDLSFEVLADDPINIERQARMIAEWGPRVYVKIPIVNTRGESHLSLIRRLAPDIRLNVTAVMTNQQVSDIGCVLSTGYNPSIVSVFAGRIADTGRDAMAVMVAAKHLLQYRRVRLLWASCREAYNIVQAERSGCDIVTVGPDILRRYLDFQHRDLDLLSQQTVQQFYEDGQKAGLTLERGVTSTKIPNDRQFSEVS